MTEHDFLPGATVQGEQRFVCTLCRRETTSPSSPKEACPGPPSRGADRIAFLQLLELRHLRVGIDVLRQLAMDQIRHTEPRPVLDEMAKALRDKAAAERGERR